MARSKKKSPRQPASTTPSQLALELRDVQTLLAQQRWLEVREKLRRLDRQFPRQMGRRWGR